MKRLASLFLFLGLAACGSNGADADPGTGTVSLVLTDSATDELTQFEVDVRDIEFTRAGGGRVSVMPRTQRIDFLQLDSVGELVAARNLPAGFYQRIDLTLDFAGAEVLIAGQTTPATVLDQQGNTITGEVAVQIDLPTGARPRARAATGHLFLLDLDLDQSLAVDAGNNTVTFSPVFSVEADPSAPRPITTTGVLDSVDLNALTFAVQRRAADGTIVNTFTVATDSSTVFQIDGVVAIGAPGLGGLAGAIGERVFVQGTFDAQALVLSAVAVEAGAGVPGNGQDWVFGHVVARSGGAGVDATLTVLGRSHDVGTGAHAYNTSHTITTALADTLVLRRGEGNSLDTDAVNIGQLVWVFGDLSGTAMDASAATGVVRMLPTSIFGVAGGAVAGDTLTLDVARFDRRDISAFDFDVSGQVQADPDAYTVDVTGLATSGITTGSRLRVIGWPNAVGGSGADATAVTIVGRSAGTQVLLCRWTPASLTAIDAASSVGQLALDVSGAATKVVGDGLGPVTLSDSPVPTIEPAASTGFYRIVRDHGVIAYTDFAAFRSAVLTRVDTIPVARVSALGTFDDSTQQFSARSIAVVFD